MANVKFALSILLALLGLAEIVQLWWFRDSAMSEVLRHFEAWSKQVMILSPQGMAMLWAVMMFSLSGFMFDIENESQSNATN